METANNVRAAEIMCRVLEMTAFMFGEPVPNEEFDDAMLGGDLLRASISFRGKFDGILCIAVPAEMCKAIASSILGVDEDTPEAEQKSVDALKEILNMTCGNLTTDLAGEDEVENLTIPEVAALDRAGWEDLKDQAETVTVMADQFPVLVSLKLETP